MKPFRVCLRTKQIASLRELADRQKIAVAALIPTGATLVLAEKGSALMTEDHPCMMRVIV
jgi:hypothetical protein